MQLACETSHRDAIVSKIACKLLYFSLDCTNCPRKESTKLPRSTISEHPPPPFVRWIVARKGRGLALEVGGGRAVGNGCCRGTAVVAEGLEGGGLSERTRDGGCFSVSVTKINFEQQIAQAFAR